MYHVCVHEDYRMRGIGKAMVVFAMEALKREKISITCAFPLIAPLICLIPFYCLLLIKGHNIPLIQNCEGGTGALG